MYFGSYYLPVEHDFSLVFIYLSEESSKLIHRIWKPFENLLETKVPGNVKSEINILFMKWISVKI